MATIFTKIIKGEIPSYRVADSEDFYAFLDIRPMAVGHTLVVPKLEIDVFFDLPNELLPSYMLFCKEIASAIEQVVPCNRIGLTVMGLEVPHAHVHLIPISRMQDMSFEKEPVSMSNQEMADLAEKINQAWEK